MPTNTSQEDRNPSHDPGESKADAGPGAVNLMLGLSISAGVLFLLALNAFSLAGAYDWQLDLLTHFRFQYTLCFLVAGIGLRLLRWKCMSGLALAALVFNLWFVAPLYLPNADTRMAARWRADASAPAFTLLHYNVNTANSRQADVADMVARSGADLVFLQEISPAWVVALEGRVPGYRPVKLEPRTDNFGIGMWVRDASNIDVVEVEARDLSGGVAQVPAIEAVVRVDGRQVRVVSLHTLPPVSLAYSEARNAQLRAAAQLARDSDLPFILIGDLNATPWSAHYRAMVREGGLTDPLRGGAALGVSAPGASWPAGLVTPGMIPIDHVLSRNGAVVVERRLGEATGSDHRPLYAEVRLAE